jgi:DNA-binding FrmR family transcriptional regulator
MTSDALKSEVTDFIDQRAKPARRGGLSSHEVFQHAVRVSAVTFSRHPRLQSSIYCTRVYYTGKAERMAHTTKDKAKLLGRVRRIRGQVEAIERALDGEQECSSVLQLMAACRGALNGLMAEVLEGHIRFHVLDPKSAKNAPQVEAAEELIDVVRTYLK